MDSRRRLTLVTFGFKYGNPNTNYYFDVSFLRNPAREEEWGLFASPDEKMREFVLSQPMCGAFLDKVIPLIRVLLDCDDDVRVGIGCSSGRHRSVIIAEDIKHHLESSNIAVQLVHREAKPW